MADMESKVVPVVSGIVGDLRQQEPNRGTVLATDKDPAEDHGLEDDKPKEDPLKHIEAHILPKLDPAFVDYFIDYITNNIPAQAVEIEEVRANPEKYRSAIALDTSDHDRVANYEVSSEDGAKIPCRVYHPDPEEHGAGPYPVHLNYHGGGFVLGDLWSDGQICLSMRTAGVVVIDVNYRHCPEAIWGKCMQDAWAALIWARDFAKTLNINPESVSVGGISAGAHISFVLQHMARDAGVPLKLCMASVPAATDPGSYKYYTESPYPSFHEFYKAPILPWARIQFFGKHCFPSGTLPELRKQWPDWWFAPIRATNWSGLCDTFIRTAEIDPLRDEGEAYGMKLVASGHKVTIKRYLGCPHTFMMMKFLKQKQDYDEDAILALKAAHGL